MFEAFFPHVSPRLAWIFFHLKLTPLRGGGWRPRSCSCNWRTRWFKPWPFDPLVWSHQQPFKGWLKHLKVMVRIAQKCGIFYQKYFGSYENFRNYILKSSIWRVKYFLSHTLWWVVCPFRTWHSSRGFIPSFLKGAGVFQPLEKYGQLKSLRSRIGVETENSLNSPRWWPCDPNCSPKGWRLPTLKRLWKNTPKNPKMDAFLVSV